MEAIYDPILGKMRSESSSTGGNPGIDESRLLPDTSGFGEDDSGRVLTYNYRRSFFNTPATGKYNDFLRVYVFIKKYMME